MRCRNCGHEIVRMWIHKQVENDTISSHGDNPRPKHTGNFMKRWCGCPNPEPEVR
jgi:hypothetical protein